jgi:hypothetical protein
MMVRRSWLAAVGFTWLAAAALGQAGAFPIEGDQAILPAGTELNEDALEKPREVFHSEASDGRKSHLVNLGHLAFSSPAIFGGPARQAGMSCESCHVNGASNPKLYVPKMSTRPGTFDTTSPLFNPKADNLTLDAVRIPSLRGSRYLAPYGHDGRMSSLRDFVRNVIVNEFAGAEPSATILDALVTYINDLDFLPNPNLGPGGRLTGKISDAERRGEALFLKPFPHQPTMSCAGCHVPSAAFVDHQQHDVGSGGIFKTPTLMNADFNAPYFHDGRYDTYDQVVAHFDRVFNLGLSEQDRGDLIAYLTAVGDGMQPYEREGAGGVLKEVNNFASVLETAIPAHDKDLIALAVDTIGGELRELTERYPERKNTSVSGGQQERANARLGLKELVLTLRRLDVAAANGRFDEAAAEYRSYRNLMFAAVPLLLGNAEPWSLFDPKTHDAHYAAFRKILQTKQSAR